MVQNVEELRPEYQLDTLASDVCFLFKRYIKVSQPRPAEGISLRASVSDGGASAGCAWRRTAGEAWRNHEATRVEEEVSGYGLPIHDKGLHLGRILRYYRASRPIRPYVLLVSIP